MIVGSPRLPRVRIVRELNGRVDKRSGECSFIINVIEIRRSMNTSQQSSTSQLVLILSLGMTMCHYYSVSPHISRNT